MTKLRPPVSIENTLYRVLGELGIERAAEVTGRDPHYLRALSDPDKRESLTVRDLVALDLACRAAGDATFPLYETVGLILVAAGAERFAAAATIGEHARELSREHGEAAAALFDAVLHPGDVRRLETALREAEEAHCASTDTIAVLTDQLARARRPEPPP
jgi:hypothetical protein